MANSDLYPCGSAAKALQRHRASLKARRETASKPRDGVLSRIMRDVRRLDRLILSDAWRDSLVSE